MNDDHKLEIEWVNIEDIKPYEKNAKIHPKKQIVEIANSISEFGFLVPIILDKDGVIIAGHGRHLASEYLKLARVPVVRAEHLSEEAIKAYRLADNKLNESEWDMSLVVEELKDLELPMIDLTGFSRDLIIENDDKDDVVPEAPANPRSKPGDVYQLGRHRLIVGDSTKPETFSTLMGGVHADMVFTDPPYNVNYKGTGDKTSRHIENDHMEASAFDAFLVSFFKSAVDSVKAGAGWYIFHSSSTQDQFKNALEEAGLQVRAQLIWNKPTAALGWGDYRWKHEPFLLRRPKGNRASLLRRPYTCDRHRLPQIRERTHRLGQTTETARSDGTHNGVDNEAREALRVRPPYAKASGAYNLRNREQLQGWRHRAGSIQWLRLDAHSGGENRANLLRSRIRPYLCRCHRAEVCGLCRESSSY